MNRRTLSICAGGLALCCLLAAAPAPRPATIISEPKKATVEALEDRALPELIPLGSFTVYAYCSCPRCCGQWSGGPTASGTMPEEGRTIAADWDVLPAGAEVYISGVGWRTVEDTGSGIDPETLPHIFEKGYSGDGRSGLGLAICREAVESHGGRLEVERTGLEGTVFAFTVMKREAQT